MKKLNQWVTEHKAILVSITLVLCYATGLIWITNYSDRVMAVVSKFRYVSYLLFALLALHTLYGNFTEWKKNNSDRFVLLYLADHAYFTIWSVLSVLIFLATHHLQPIVFLFMILAMADTGFDRHIRPIFLVHAMFMLVVLTLYNRGLLDQVITVRAADKLRYSLGYLYALELQGHYLFIVLMYIYIRKKKFGFSDFLILNILNTVLFDSSDARNDYYVIILVTLIALIINFIGADRFMKKLHLWFWEGCAFLGIFTPFLLVHLYNPQSAAWERINQILTNRLSVTAGVLKTTGQPLFGKVMDWIGLGFVGIDVPDGYNWVDFSFVKDSIDYGWIFVVMLALGFLFMIAWSFCKKDVFGVLIIEGLILSSIMEYHTFMPSVYPLILMMCSGILMTNKEQIAVFTRKRKDE